MASEVLWAVPLLRHFLVKLVKPFGLLVDEIASFEALADVVQQLQKLKLWSNIPPSEADLLQRLQAQHYTAFKKAYGAKSCVPKHHFSMHIPSQLKRLGILVDEFPTERKHKLPKEVLQYYRQSKATHHLELHAVTRLNLLQLDEMSAGARAGDLQGPTQQLQDRRHTADCARLAFGTAVQRGQVILADDCCYVVSACLRDAVGPAIDREALHLRWHRWPQLCKTVERFWAVRCISLECPLCTRSPTVFVVFACFWRSKLRSAPHAVNATRFFFVADAHPRLTASCRSLCTAGTQTS